MNSIVNPSGTGKPDLIIKIAFENFKRWHFDLVFNQHTPIEQIKLAPKVKGKNIPN